VDVPNAVKRYIGPIRAVSFKRFINIFHKIKYKALEDPSMAYHTILFRQLLYAVEWKVGVNVIDIS
jgi:hypothetical protein